MSIPFAVADFVDGVAFGAVAGAVGLGPAPATAFSAVAYSGTAQYAALSVLGQHGTLVGVLVAVAALNARYVFFGASVAPALSPGILRKLAESQLLTDASWALSLRDGRPQRSILVGAGLSSLGAWTGGTAIGAVAGARLPDYRAIGLDAALPAFFLCLLLARSSRRELGRAAVAALVAVALAPFLPPGVPLLVVLAGALVAGGGR